MGNRYVSVSITRQTKAISKDGFGLSLILSTEKVAAYKEYIDLVEIGVDYGITSETYKMASVIFSQTPRPSKLAIYGMLYVTPTNTPADLVTALNTLITSHNDFFYLHCTVQTDDVVTALSDWIDTQSKLYFASTSNKTLHSLLLSSNTILLVHPNPETYPAAGWVGVCSPQDIGSYTWTFKTINGILPVTYTSSEIASIEDGASSYIKESGVNITSKGITTKGEYIDILQGQYYLESEIAYAVFSLLARTPKIPFTVQGINMVVAELESVLKDASNKGVIAKDENEKPLYNITIPNLSDISAADRTNRTLPNVGWTSTLAGAVENVDFNGVLAI